MLQIAVVSSCFQITPSFFLIFFVFICFHICRSRLALYDIFCARCSTVQRTRSRKRQQTFPPCTMRVSVLTCWTMMHQHASTIIHKPAPSVPNIGTPWVYPKIASFVGQLCYRSEMEWITQFVKRVQHFLDNPSLKIFDVWKSGTAAMGEASGEGTTRSAGCWTSGTAGVWVPWTLWADQYWSICLELGL